MKEIQLTQGKVTLVDDEDYEYLNQWKWCSQECHNTTYAIRTEYENIDNKTYKKKTIRMHRIIMKTTFDLQVDHRDHNGLNNQKSNLRNCTRAENGMNQRAHGKSIYLGVSYNNKCIVAGIKINGIRNHIGTFETEIEAAHAYDIKASMYFGEFANLNFK